MKKALLFSFLLSFVPIGARAINAPVAENGQSLQTIDFVGCQVANIDASTGTAAIILNSTGTNGTSSGRAIVYGVIASSVAQSDYLVLKDTTGIGNISSYLAPQSTLTTLSIATAAVITNWIQNNVSTINIVFPYPTLNLIKFPVPIQFQYGILAQVSAAPVTNGGVARWTILYRKIDSSEK